MTNQTIVEQVAEQIAFRIASGAYTPGERLASVRKLAADFDINPSTVQVVLARLQAGGFVEVHPGVGFLVRDIALFGGIETWRLMFKFAQKLPAQAAKIFGDFLATKRLLIGDALRTIAAAPDRFDPSGLRRAVDRLDLLVAANPEATAEIAKAELHAVRMMMAAIDQRVTLAIFNSVGDILLETPILLEAMYAQPKGNVVVWKHLLKRWQSGTLRTSEVEKVQASIAAFDEETVKRFQAMASHSAARVKVARY